MVAKSYLGSSVGSRDGVVKLAQLICTQDNMWAMYDVIPFCLSATARALIVGLPLAMKFPSSMPECLGYYEDRYQNMGKPCQLSLNRDYPFRDYPDERAHNEDSQVVRTWMGLTIIVIATVGRILKSHASAGHWSLGECLYSPDINSPLVSSKSMSLTVMRRKKKSAQEFIILKQICTENKHFLKYILGHLV